MTPATDPAALTNQIRALWTRVRPSMLARVDVIDRAVVAHLEGRLDEAARADAQRAAHQLAGSAGTFGAADASRIARALELALADGPEQGLWAAEQVAALRAALEDLPVAVPATPGDALPVRVVADDDALAQRLEAPLRSRGLRSLGRSEPSVQAAAVLVDADSAAWRECPEAVAEHSGAAPRVPVLLISVEGGVTDRVAAARAGVSDFLSRRLSDLDIAEAVANAVADARPGRERVLACDDDPTVLAVIRRVLEAAGVNVVTVEDALAFWDVLDSGRPDLVLLDLDIPQISGLDLCKALRADPAHGTLPIMFLTGSDDAGSVHRMFAAGADDFVAKPIVGPELAARVGNRLERVRAHRRLADTDSMTGLTNRRASQLWIERMLRTADRYQQPAALCVLDLDRFKPINDTFGHSAGDRALQWLAQLLRQRFRGSDVAARWGGDEFVVAMPGMGRHDAVQRIAELLEEVRDQPVAAPDGREFTVTFSAGVAEYPADGADRDALYRAADTALDAAKRAGANQVTEFRHAAVAEPGCDVAIVEDDESLARLLLGALETRGYRATWIADGDDAWRRLGGDAPELRPKVVLLDVNLPGVNGLRLLRDLGASKTLERTRVVMLTAHAGEPEVLEALRLGAADHVTKPFSVPVLLERIRRLLNQQTR